MMTAFDELYCKLYVDTDLDRDGLADFICALLHSSRQSFHGIFADFGEVEVKRNEDFLPVAAREQADDFVYYRYYLDVFPAGAISEQQYVTGVAKLLRGLKKAGMPAAAACSFEEELQAALSKGIVLKLDAVPALCEDCRTTRSIYHFPSFLYGSGFAYTEDGRRYVFVNYLEDPAYEQVDQIVKKMLGETVSSDRSNACLRAAFGAACDPLDGIATDAARETPSCQSCGSGRLTALPEAPQEMALVELPIVTHDAWDRLDDAAKEALVLNVLRRKGLI